MRATYHLRQDPRRPEEQWLAWALVPLPVTRHGHLERQPRQAQLREQWTEQPTERGLPVQVQVVEAPGAVAVVVVWVHHRGRPGS